MSNILYKHDTKALRNRISSYLGNKGEVWILFDNLDKGWPPRGLDEQDILILRCLVEAMNKMQRHLDKTGTVCRTVVFLRNDIYEMLVDQTTDRAKTSRVIIDWTDQEILREMLRRRLVSNGLDENTQFDQIWRTICVSHIGTEESSQYLIDRCLMRPRSLIDLVYHCRSHAVNLNRPKIEMSDITEGEKNYSSELVENICLEMRDIYPDFEPNLKDLLYEFIGCSVRLSHEETLRLLANYGIAEDLQSKLLDLLLWWGFFGVLRENQNIAYIYAVQYNMSHLRALIRKSRGDPIYYINPAFWAGLEIRC